MIELIDSPDDLKKLTIAQLKEYAQEVRQFLIENISKTGGHLASNLGVVELSIALHYVYDSPQDKLIFDVGHQSYVHKIITGRRNQFDLLRQYGGLSGFPKRSESKHDIFNTGHSGTSISAAVGVKRAMRLQGDPGHVVAVIGDGAMSGGMVFEAMNDIGRYDDENILVILNDNQMSISKNVGSMAQYLTKMRTAKGYNLMKNKLAHTLNKTIFGKKTVTALKKWKDKIRHLFMPETFFEALGFTYIGMVNGHNLPQLIFILQRVKEMNGKILLHVSTTKGKGYEFAEQCPDIYHGVSRFEIEKNIDNNEKIDYSKVLGEKLCTLAQANNKIVAVTAAMSEGTGLSEFSARYPKRYFDVGIAEQHAVTMAAGLAANSMVPVVPIYSSFLQRAYDQILHDVGLQNLHVVFGVDRAGIVGEDGETHQGIYDLSYLCDIPNMTVYAPACFRQLEDMLEEAINHTLGPVALRYPRGQEKVTFPYQKGAKNSLLWRGEDIAIFACGRMVETAWRVAKELEKRGKHVTLVNLCVLKPLDIDFLVEHATGKKLIVTIEDNIKTGGIGQQIVASLCQRGVFVPCLIKAFENGSIPQGNIALLMKQYRMDEESILEEICNND